MQALDLKDRKFGRWTVIKRLENTEYGNTRWLCECECGNSKKLLGGRLVSGGSQSCGCLRRDNLIKHGHAMKGLISRTYTTWISMLQRCNNSKNRNYRHYGGRGIKVCERWLKFENFLEDMGERPEDLTLERENNDGNYEPGNCKWITQKKQCRNNRHTKLNPLKVQVIKKLLKESKLMQKEIAEIFHVDPMTICNINTERSWGDIHY